MSDSRNFFGSILAVLSGLTLFVGCREPVSSQTVVIHRDAVQSIAVEEFPIEFDGTREVPVPVTLRDPFVLFTDGDAPVVLRTEIELKLPDVIPSAPPPLLVPGAQLEPPGSGEKSVEGKVTFSGRVVYRAGDRTLWIVGLEADDYRIDGLPEELAGPVLQAVADALEKRLQSSEVGRADASVGAGEGVAVRGVSVVDGALHVTVGRP